MEIGFTGTQIGMTDKQKETVKKFLLSFKAARFHHGDCMGADSQAHDIAKELGIAITIHPPLNSSKRALKTGYKKLLDKKPHVERNHDIVDNCRILIACPKGNDEQLRSGTWATVRYAKKQKVETIIIYPDGMWVTN